MPPPCILFHLSALPISNLIRSASPASARVHHPFRPRPTPSTGPLGVPRARPTAQASVRVARLQRPFTGDPPRNPPAVRRRPAPRFAQFSDGFPGDPTPGETQIESLDRRRNSAANLHGIKIPLPYLLGQKPGIKIGHALAAVIPETTVRHECLPSACTTACTTPTARDAEPPPRAPQASAALTRRARAQARRLHHGLHHAHCTRRGASAARTSGGFLESRERTITTTTTTIPPSKVYSSGAESHATPTRFEVSRQCGVLHACRCSSLTAPPQIVPPPSAAPPPPAITVRRCAMRQ